MSKPALSEQALSDIEGLCAGIARKMAVERTAEILHEGARLALRYRKSFHHPWPRSVDLFAEVMAPSLDHAVALRARLLSDPAEPHLASVFGVEVERDGAAIAEAGYDGCWTSAVMVHPLDAGAQVSGFAFERVERPEQVAEINAHETAFPASAAALADPALATLLARDGAGQVVATGGVVIGLADAAYVYDMWTAPAVRRRGAGRAMLSALHAVARDAGATRAVLLPSLMAVETKFYVNCGYTVSSRMAVLLSKAS